MPDLSVVIVNYNVSYFLEQCLHSVFKASEEITCEVFVVDNNSVDGSVEMVQEKFPQAILIANKDNVGFSRANNQAIRISKGRHVLLLNPDTLVEEDTFVKSVNYMDNHPDVGGLGVKMIDGKGQFLPESKRGLPTPSVAFYKIFGLSALFPKSKIFSEYHLGYLSKDETHEVPVLSGAYMMMRAETLKKVGLLDEEYFMYGEDIDLSYRITLGGYKNVYFSDTRIIHYKGESTKKSSVNYVFVFYRAMLIFARKHFSARLAKTFSFLINLAIYLRAFVAIANRFVKKAIVPVVDAILVFSGLLLLKSNYEAYTGISYDSDLSNFAFLSYTGIWMLNIYIFGGYDKPIKLINILKGIAIGTIGILAVYSLLPEDLRFSRALILLGTLSTGTTYVLFRTVLHLLKFNAFRIGNPAPQKLGVVSKLSEFNRIKSLILDVDERVAGQIHHIQSICDSDNYDLPKVLQEFIEVYKLDAIIFSGEDIPSHQIISLMASVKSQKLDFKIAPPESLYIIGSNSIEKGGELFIMDLNAINKPKNKRKKRALDVGFSLIFLLSLPISIWFVKQKKGFIQNIFRVLLGAKSWVGFSPQGQITQNLPKIKQGVLHPIDRLKRVKSHDDTARKLNAVYARAYSTRNDVAIIGSGFKSLGRE